MDATEYGAVKAALETGLAGLVIEYPSPASRGGNIDWQVMDAGELLGFFLRTGLRVRIVAPMPERPARVMELVRKGQAGL